MWHRTDNLVVSSDGELELEFDENRIITDEDRAQALELKAKANAAFKGVFCVQSLGAERSLTIAAKDFNQSIDLYTDAIRLNPKEPTLWNNRAMSKYKLEEHGAAIADASKPHA